MASGKRQRPGRAIGGHRPHIYAPGTARTPAAGHPAAGRLLPAARAPFSSNLQNQYPPGPTSSLPRRSGRHRDRYPAAGAQRLPTGGQVLPPAADRQLPARKQKKQQPSQPRVVHAPRPGIEARTREARRPTPNAPAPRGSGPVVLNF